MSTVAIFMCRPTQWLSAIVLTLCNNFPLTDQSMARLPWLSVVKMVGVGQLASITKQRASYLERPMSKLITAAATNNPPQIKMTQSNQFGLLP